MLCLCSLASFSFDILRPSFCCAPTSSAHPVVFCIFLWIQLGICSNKLLLYRWSCIVSCCGEFLTVCQLGCFERLRSAISSRHLSSSHSTFSSFFVCFGFVTAVILLLTPGRDTARYHLFTLSHTVLPCFFLPVVRNASLWFSHKCSSNDLRCPPILIHPIGACNPQ